MAKRTDAEEKAIVAVAGRMNSIWLKLSSTVVKAGGSVQNIWRLDTDENLMIQVAQLIIGAVVKPVAQVAWKLVFTWILAVCRFTYNRHPDITAENFPPQSGDFTVKEVFDIAIPRRMSTPEVLAYLDQEGYRAATLVELLFWWLTNPTKQTSCFVIALGSVLDDRAPYIYSDIDCGYLNLHTLAHAEFSSARFAAVRK